MIEACCSAVVGGLQQDFPAARGGGPRGTYAEQHSYPGRWLQTCKARRRPWRHVPDVASLEK